MALHTVFKSVFVRGFAPLMAASSLALLASPALADWKNTKARVLSFTAPVLTVKRVKC